MFTRLSDVAHLGLVRCIYPTATHSRMEHSIGSFRNCCLYVESLLNDPYNPFFCQIADESDIKAILLASLLHDLGQFPLAHEIEEVSSIRHTSLSLLFLDNPTPNTYGETIKDIIQNEDWGWGIPINKVKSILSFSGANTDGLFVANIKEQLFASIIDGPIDVDKLDYLIRDSEECRLRYGDLVDFDRLVKNLTIIITKEHNHRVDVSLGVYEKAQSAAESVIFARYLLYQSVYWHHTSRAIRSMIQEALRRAISLIDTRPKGAKKQKDLIADLTNYLGVSSAPSPRTVSDVLLFIYQHTDDVGKMLIDLIKERRFYKRIVTFHEDRPFFEGQDTPIEKFRGALSKATYRQALCDKIREIYTQHEAALSGRSSKSILLTEGNLSRVRQVLLSDGSLLLDAPRPVPGSTNPLKVLPEPERLQRNYSTRMEAAQRMSEVWEQFHYRLMKVAAKARIYCHPDCRDTLMAVVSPEDIAKVAIALTDKF